MKHLARRTLCRVLLALLAACVIAGTLVGPVAQDPAYHDFADRRTLLGIPNFFDVLSNLPFAVIGFMGLRRFRGRGVERRSLQVLMLGVTLTAAGSAWYHLDPRNGTLVWDRLPMTLGFMGLLTYVVAERLSARVAAWLLVPLVLAGIASVWWWHVTESRGEGDLRPYALVQFFPMLAIPLLLLLRPARRPGARWLWMAMGLYLATKGLEALDHGIWELPGTPSGHTLKHLVSGAATACFLPLGEALKISRMDRE